MKKYQTASHPAELRIQVSGDTVEHLYINAADAMADILSSKRYANIASTEKIVVTAGDQEEALVDFLNEVLAQSHIERSVYIPVTICVTEEKGKVSVEASMQRYLVPAFDEDIKAVTHQDVHIKHKKGVWETDLVFDI